MKCFRMMARIGGNADRCGSEAPHRRRYARKPSSISAWDRGVTAFETSAQKGKADAWFVAVDIPLAIRRLNAQGGSTTLEQLTKKVGLFC